MSLSLNCLIQGEVQEKIFTVKIEKTENIAILKKLIKKKAAPHLDHVAASDLILWMVNLRLDELGVEPVHVNLDTYSKLSPPRMKLPSFFDGTVDDERLHIIAKAPVLDPIKLLSLNCFVLGEDLKVFTVKIPKTENVSTLKDFIKEKKAPHLDHVAASDLVLFQVSLPRDADVDARLQNANLEPLDSLLPLSQVFLCVEESHVHILVQVPTNVPPYPSSFNPSVNDRGGKKITPNEQLLNVNVTEKRINEKVESLRKEITRFLKDPEPPIWVPPDYVTSENREFLEGLQIPCYRKNGNPSLLFHNLKVDDDGEIEKIFAGDGALIVCNKSGSGKTRRILELLTKYWGFYFVAIPDSNGVGVRDLETTLDNVAGDKEWTSDLNVIEPGERSSRNKTNSLLAARHLLKLLAARIVVFQLFIKIAIELDGELMEKHKRFWLFFQLSDRLGAHSVTSHPFVQIIMSLDHASYESLTTLVQRHADILKKLQTSRFIIGLDEAQRAARLFPYSFISSGSNTTFRSIIREIVKAFTGTQLGVTKLVVSGTGVLVADLEDAVASGVSKPGAVEQFHELGMFDEWSKLEPFLKRYIPTSFLETHSGDCFQHRIREYLQGRYRFSVSFIELFLRNGFDSPHKLLTSFINAHTACLPGNIGEPFTSNEPELHIKINLRGFEWDRLRADPESCKQAVEIVQSHLTLGKSPTFGPVTDKLVEYGLADLRDNHQGHIVEPLAFLSLIKWLQKQDDLNLATNISSRLADENSRWGAYEEVIILYLLRALRYPVLLSTIFKFRNPPPVWANEKVQIVGILGGVGVPVDVLGSAPVNPGLGVVHYASNIDEVIAWLESTGAALAAAPAVLVVTHLFGPDVLIRLSRDVILMGQLKSYTTGNNASFAADTIRDALISLHEDHWFKNESSHKRRKLIDVVEKHRILRFVGGFPLPANFDSRASSVQGALIALGSNVVLASINVDPFKAHFISEHEAKNILGPMEAALERKRTGHGKRKASEIDID